MIHTDSRILAILHDKNPKEFNKNISDILSKQPSLEKYFIKHNDSYLIDINHIDIAKTILKHTVKPLDKASKLSKDNVIDWFITLCKEDINIPITKQAKDMMKRCEETE